MTSNNEINRLDIGIPGLNSILMGGLPAGQMYLLEGDPGTGKTTMAMQFIIAGMRAGERGLYITLSEPVTELQSSAKSHGWDVNDLPIAEFTPDEASLNPEQQYTVFHPSEVELAQTIQRLTAEIDRVNPDRLVIDSLSELRLLASDQMRYRRQLLALKHFFVGRSTTVLLLDDRVTQAHDLQLQSIAHGVLRLEKLNRSYGRTRRQMEVVKLRGSAYNEGFHDYTINFGGAVVYPRLIAANYESDYPEGRITSNLPRLDAMFQTGVARGSTTLVIGPAGVGKSNLAMQFAYAAASRGDRAIIYAFDEVLRTIRDRATRMGLDVAAEIARGTLAMSQVDPAELSPGEFVGQIRADVETRDTRVVVIDSLNGFLNSMPGERDMILHMHELLAYLNQKGVTTFLVMAQHGFIGSTETPEDVSYLADTVVMLRFFEDDGRLRQVISVVKQRSGPHEKTLRELIIADHGIEIGEPLSGMRGVLTGVPGPQAAP